MTLEELYRLLRSSHVQSQGIVDTLQEPLVVLDKGFTVLAANPAFYRTFKVEREDTLGNILFDLGNGQWNIPGLRKVLAEVVPNAAAVIGYGVTHDFSAIGRRNMLVSARKLSHPDDNSTQMLVVFEDVTERQKADFAKDILVAETRHRMNNLMALVRAVARQTEAKGLTGEQYRNVFMGRFEAVLNAQEFISAHGSEADLSTLIGKSLGGIAAGRAILAPGPAVAPQKVLEEEVSARIRRIVSDGWTRMSAAEARGGMQKLVGHERLQAVESMTRFIFENGHTEITAEQVANSVGYHPNYAMAVFKRSVGISIKKAILRHRLDTARALLLPTDRTISDVAFNSGFGSLSSFYAAFSKRFNASPVAFRTQV